MKLKCFQKFDHFFAKKQTPILIILLCHGTSINRGMNDVITFTMYAKRNLLCISFVVGFGDSEDVIDDAPSNILIPVHAEHMLNMHLIRIP